jgi:C1A family cysteine protease
MKNKLLIIILFTVFCFRGFSQEDPLVKDSQGVFKVKTKDEMAKGEAKLTAKGKAAFDKAKNEFRNIKGAKFEIAPNEQLNQDPKELLGIPEFEKPDLNMAKKQNEENKKKQDEIRRNLKEAGVDAAQLDFDYKVNYSNNDFPSCFWDRDILTPVKNQGNCGSCWAFAACAAFEHTYAALRGTKLDLSEQDVVACGKNCKNADCGDCVHGGWSDCAFEFMACKGVASENVYPYNISQSNTCIPKTKFMWAYTWGQIYPGRFPTVPEIKYYMSIFGAVVTYMKAGISTFISYGGGVYNGYPSSSGGNIDHAVTIVGWCDVLNAWIIKNSWGTGWGPFGGYAYVGYDQCNIGKYVFWVYPKP